MSTQVAPEEWGTLMPVPKANYSDQIRGCLCDVEPSHNMAVTLMQTPDHRAIALCQSCLDLVRVLQGWQ